VDSHGEVIKRDDPAAAATKQHLYVVLDDHKDGYGIHKLDLGMEKDDDDQDGGAQRLPGPPVLRVAFPDVNEDAQFAALGSTIVATYISPILDLGWTGCSYDRSESGGVLIYDTNTVSQLVSPQIPSGLAFGYDEAIAAGNNRLYMLKSCGYGYEYSSDDEYLFRTGLHCLQNYDDGTVKVGNDKISWRWQPLSPSSPWRWSENDDLNILPFFDAYITAHAVHVPPGAPSPQDHELLVSANYNRNTGMGATFSFCSRSRKWTLRSDWELPVVGHAHYDGELDTWVGLHAVETDTYRRPPTDGRLCIGHVMSDPEEWKVGTEKLFRLDKDVAAGWRHIDAKLVPLAVNKLQGSKYCLMERLRPEGEQKDSLGDGDKCLLRLTAFYVERGKDGEPVVSDHRLVRSYKVSRYNTMFDAQVFWM
jgi:hypothetical protein